MPGKKISLSVVINAQDGGEDIEVAIKSVRELADEVIVVDQGSTDDTALVSRKLGAKVFSHKRVPYVELARNFAISKASNDWVLVLDPDEEIGAELRRGIELELKKPKADYYRLPRKNIIFGKWIRHSRWWPDMNIRLFKKGHVSWSEEIHRVPTTSGKGADFPEKEEFAIIHRNYKTIDDYLEKMLRYTKVQAKELVKKGYKFEWADIIRKPLGEFLSRFFAGQGYKDGLHGLILALLQAFSELVVYVRVWGEGGYKEQDIEKKEIQDIFKNGIYELKWWIRKEFSWLRNLLSR